MTAGNFDASLLKRANEVWAADDKQEATDLLRIGLLDHPRSSNVWYLYAMRLLETQRPDAAFEAMKNAVEIDPGNFVALEMLIELAGKRPERQAAVRRAYDGLPALLRQRADRHRLSFDFVVPGKVHEALDVLADSPDRVTRAAVSLLQHEGDAKPSRPAWLSEDEYSVSRLLVSLAAGRRTLALELIEALPDRAVPATSVRLAIRRDLRAGRTQGAHKLLTEYVRLRPEDQWGKRQLAATAPRTHSNFQLAKTGFPFPRKASAPSFEPERNKALYLLHNSLPYHSAGYATRTHGLLSAVRDRGWDVRGVTRLGYPYDMPKHGDLGAISSQDVVDGVPYHRLSTRPGIEKKNPVPDYVKRYGTALKTYAEQERPFVIHGASNHWNGLTAVSVANRLGIPSIYEVRGLWEVTRGSRDPVWAQGGMYRFMARMEADAAGHATHVIAITDALKQELVSRGVDAEKITVVPNGVDAERFVPRARDEALAAHLGVAGKTVIGYVGSVLDYEGLGLLIDAAARMAATRSDFVVLIVGDGAELESFRGRVEDEGLAEVVRFTGRVPHEEVEQYYSLVDIAPFPRLPLPVCEMVSPLKPFEALAMEKAVVASDVAALAEIIEPGVNGLLHRKGDVNDLMHKLVHLIDNPDEREALARRGRAWVISNRQWPHLGSRINDIYTQLGGVPAPKDVASD